MTDTPHTDAQFTVPLSETIAAALQKCAGDLAVLQEMMQRLQGALVFYQADIAANYPPAVLQEKYTSQMRNIRHLRRALKKARKYLRKHGP